MQSLEEVERVCEANTLAQADRYMSEHREGGTCRECRNCRMLCFDAAPKRLADELNADYGICTETDAPELVALDDYHDWDECWVEGEFA